MSEQTREDLKNAFLSGQTLTEQKMHDLLDSLLHKNEDSEDIIETVYDEQGKLPAERLPSEIDAIFIPFRNTPEVIDAYIGSEGEIVSDGETVRLMDGVKLGGTKMARKDEISSGTTIPFTIAAFANETMKSYTFTKVPDVKFQGASPALVGIVFGSNVEEIGTNALSGAEIQGDLIIPDNITKIGSTAFLSVQSSGQFKFPKFLENFGSGQFLHLNIPNNTNPIVIPKDCNISTLFAGIQAINTDFSYEYPRPNPVIPQSMHVGGTLKSLNLTGLTEVSDEAIEYMNSDEGLPPLVLTIGKTLTTIGERCFPNSKMDKIHLYENVILIKGESFTSSIATDYVAICSPIISLGTDCFSGTQILSGDIYLNFPFTSLPVFSEGYTFFDSTLKRIHLRPAPFTPAGWTIGPNQTIGGTSGVEVIADWAEFPEVI
jgi:hypothetical protein